MPIKYDNRGDLNRTGKILPHGISGHISKNILNRKDYKNGNNNCKTQNNNLW